MGRSKIAGALAAAACALAACGGESDEEEVRATVKSFGTATAERDYQKLCDELLSRTLVAQAEQQLPCEQAWRVGLDGVQSPRLTVRAVDVKGDRASVRVYSLATGQKPSTDVIGLVRQDDRWRIDSLAEPDTGGPIPNP